MSKYCSLCGELNNTTGKQCQRCYLYLKKHPEGKYELPPKGEIHYAPNGDPICHICGMAYRKLGNHIAFKHHISQKEYREMFRLFHNTQLSNDDYKKLMRGYNTRDFDKVVKENLLLKGTSTRITLENNLPGRKIGNNQIKEVRHEDSKSLLA